MSETMHTVAERPMLVLEYAPALERAWVRCRREVHDLGPWVIWPSRRSWAWLALLVMAAASLSWLPRNYQLVAEFDALDDGPSVIAGTNRIFYRAADHSLWIRDFGSDAGGAAQLQLEPSATHTSPVVTQDGSRVVGLAATDLVFWETRTGDMVGRMSLAKLKHDGETPDEWADMALSPDGTRLVVSYGKGQLVVWDVSSARSARRIAARGADSLMPDARPQFSGDGWYLLVTNDQIVWIGDADTLAEQMRLSGRARGDATAGWAAGGRHLIVSSTPDLLGALPNYLHAERACSRGEHWWALAVIDPADPARPLARVAYWSLYNRLGELSRDGRTLTIDREGVYDVPSARRTDWSEDELDVVTTSSDQRTRIVATGYDLPLHVLDARSGRLTARLPYSDRTSILADGQTVLSWKWTGPARARRLDPQRWTERSVWWSWRLWIMLPIAALWARSLSRDARRRSRVEPPRRFDAIAAGGMVAAGALAVAVGLAQTAVDRGFELDAWWSGDPVGGMLIAAAICGMGVLSGSRVWLWATRALFMLFAIVAVVHASGYHADTFPYVMLDTLWTPPLIALHATGAGCAVVAAVVSLRLGRAVRAA